MRSLKTVLALFCLWCYCAGTTPSIATIVDQIAHSIGEYQRQGNTVKRLASQEALKQCLSSYEKSVQQCPEHASANVNTTALNFMAQNGMTMEQSQQAIDAANAKTAAALAKALAKAKFAHQYQIDTYTENRMGPQDPSSDPEGGVRNPPETDFMLMLDESTNLNSENNPDSTCDTAFVRVHEICSKLNTIAKSTAASPNAAERDRIAQDAVKAFRSDLKRELQEIQAMKVGLSNATATNHNATSLDRSGSELDLATELI